jgi:ABC-type branched-subunit amino acid transport system substrate-binding protein
MLYSQRAGFEAGETEEDAKDEAGGEKPGTVHIAVTYLTLPPTANIWPHPLSAESVETLAQMAEDEINTYCIENNVSHRFDFMCKPVMHFGGTPPGLEEAKALKEAGVDLIVGHDFSVACAKSFDYVNENKMLMLSPTVSGLGMSLPGDNMFSLRPHTRYDVYAKMLKDVGTEVIVVLDDGLPRWAPEFDALNASYSKVGGLIHSRILYDLNAPSFAPYLEDAAAEIQEAQDRHGASHVGFVVTLPGWDENAVFFDQAENYPVLSKVVWFDLKGSSKEWVIERHEDDLFARHNLLSIMKTPAHTPKFESFRRRYLEATGSDVAPSRWYDQAARYDAMWLMALSVVEADSRNASDVKKVLPEVSAEYVGVVGPCELDENGDRLACDYEVMGWFETEDGVYEFVSLGNYDAVDDDFKWNEERVASLTYLEPKTG